MVKKSMNVEEILLKIVLENAITHNGKAAFNSVMKTFAGTYPEYRPQIKQLIPTIQKLIADVNAMEIGSQIEKLKQLDPTSKVFQEAKREKKEISLPPLEGAIEGKVVTRMPPAPNGYLHLGHAKAAFIDWEYAQTYKGRMILRFDDTNPKDVIEKFYDEQKKDLKWLGITWEQEYCTSDNIETHYKLAKKLIEQGDAYVCTCSNETIRDNRQKQIECACRSLTSEEHLKRWERMFSEFQEGEAILRFKGDMKSKNTAMRDPTLFRIIDHTHPRHGNKYRVWPTYDFAGPIEDSLSGVTHAFRTKEYELRDELYFALLERLNLRKPKLLEFARLNVRDMITSKRKIKKLIQEGYVSGFDDIRLITLRALKRRGFIPAAIKQFVLSQGISKAEGEVTFEQLEVINRKLIDESTPRRFFVSNPILLKIENSDPITATIPNHPDNQTLGKRTVTVQDAVYISQEDAQRFQVDTVFRLKDLFNVKVTEISKEHITAEFHSKKVLQNTLKIQWVPSHENVDVTVLKANPPILLKDPETGNETFNKNSLITIHGLGEPNLTQANVDDRFQFERFGFVRIDSIQNGKITAVYTHK